MVFELIAIAHQTIETASGSGRRGVSADCYKRNWRCAASRLFAAKNAALTPTKAGLDSTSGTGHRFCIPLRLRLRPFVAGGDGLSPRSRPPLAIRRPDTTIRQNRSRSQALRSQPRLPCRAPAGADSFLHSRPVPFAPLSHLRAGRSRSTQV